MPASPRDFLLYSRMTGKPMPQNAIERMRMAPEVYQFTKDFARKPNLLEKTGNLVKGIGKNIGAGIALAATSPAFVEDKEMTDVTGDVQPEIPAALQVEQEKTRRAELEIAGRENIARMANTGVQKGDLNTNFTFVGKQEDTTADNFEQDVVPQQTTDEMGQRSATQQAELETNQTIADNTAASQDFTPKKSVEEVEADLARDMETAGRTRIGGPANVTEAVDKFLGQPGLDPVLLAAMNARGQQEELIGSPLGDNPQTPPGQTNSAVSQPFAENIEPITDPSPNLNPQLQSILNTLARSRADLSQGQRMDLARQMVSPNELAGKDQAAFEAITAGIPKAEQEAARDRIKEKTARKRNQSTLEKVEEFKSRIMSNKKSSFVDSMGLNLSADSVPTTDFDIRQKGGGTKRYAFGLSSPMAVSLNEMVEDGSIKDESLGDLFNLIKKSKRDNTGMAFDIGL